MNEEKKGAPTRRAATNHTRHARPLVGKYQNNARRVEKSYVLKGSLSASSTCSFSLTSFNSAFFIEGFFKATVCTNAV